MITNEQQERLKQLMSLFLEENSKLNLSALRTEESCWTGNILDSIAGLDVPEIKQLPKNATILDAGTGGGFPFLPLALMLPEQNHIGLDATQKKLDAIERIIQQLGLQNAKTINGRLEELAHKPHLREQCDMVTARAVAPLNVLIEYLAGFVKVNGFILAWKSMNIDQEMQESLTIRSQLSCHLTRTFTYDLGGDWGKRQILVFQKIKPTPKDFPRGIGIPKKTPIV